MDEIKRGSIYWCELDPAVGHEQKGRRPILILSNDIFNKYSKTVIAVALTSQAQKAAYPLTLELKNKFLPSRSWIKISQIRTLSTERIGDKITEITKDQIDLVIRGLNQILN